MCLWDNDTKINPEIVRGVKWIYLDLSGKDHITSFYVGCDEPYGSIIMTCCRSFLLNGFGAKSGKEYDDCVKSCETFGDNCYYA
jgi:hypothetical protein